jgi:uncharacterized repeat protein (TIGR03803 family)
VNHGFVPTRTCLSPRPAIAMLAVILWVATMASAVQAQTFQVLHAFAAQADGGQPETGLTIDRAGNLYGTAHFSISNGSEVFKMTHGNSGWHLQVLHMFQNAEGGRPLSPVAFGPDGALYGTMFGGGQYNYGTVYALRPPRSICRVVPCPWNATVLYSFTGGPDSKFPEGHLTFDQAGNIYGTAAGEDLAGNPGAGFQYGSVWELVRSGVSYTMSVVYGFPGTPLAPQTPLGGVTFDQAGNLYGTTVAGGGHEQGAIFELSPSGEGWTSQLLYSFYNAQGSAPEAGLISDSAGNMYGVSFMNPYVFKLTPSGGGWNFTNLYQVSTGNGPNSDLTIDSQGNLYGANLSGGQHNRGNVFKLTPSNGTWIYTDLYDFTGENDGGAPNGKVVIDASGNIYGTASQNGAYGWGTVWEITP